MIDTATVISAQRTAWEQRLDQLGDFLAEQPESAGAPESPEPRSTP
jgi:hypothetical protein